MPGYGLAPDVSLTRIVGQVHEALDLVAARIAALQAESGADSIGIFGGGGLTNEKAYALGKFARAVLRTSQIDYNGRWCMSSAAAAANKALGLIKQNVDADGWLHDVVDPETAWTPLGPGNYSPEGQAFVVLLQAAWRDFAASFV